MSLPQDCYEGLKYRCMRDGCDQVLSTLRSLTYHLHLHNMGSETSGGADRWVHIVENCNDAEAICNARSVVASTPATIVANILGVGETSWYTAVHGWSI